MNTNTKPGHSAAGVGEGSYDADALNAYLMDQRDLKDERVQNDDSFPLAKRIYCKDGFSLSVQATHGAYCTPRRNVGPWIKVEVGFPSAAPELIMEWAEQPEKPTDTVYGHVPIKLVAELIALHGGPVEPLQDGQSSNGRTPDPASDGGAS